MSILWKTILAGAAALVLAASAALASGFNIPEQGAKASGMAGAWIAGADDASATWYNPAALVWLEDREIQIGANLITAGSDLDLAVADPRFGSGTVAAESHLGTPLHLYYAHKLGDRFAFGIGVNNPFGLITDWERRPVSFSAQESELVTFYVNPNVAFRLGDRWSVALGASFVDAEIESFSREVPIDLDGNPLNGFEVIGSSNLTGSGDDIGWNVALHRRSTDWSFGLTYRSEVTIDIAGDVEFANFGPLAPFFRNSPGGAELTLPDLAAAGLKWGGPRGWSYELAVTWVGWSVFDTLVIDIANNVPGFVEDIRLREDWDDSFAYRFGVDWEGDGPHSWRFGAVVDEGAAPQDTLRASIPESDRTGVTVGYGYEGRGRWSFDLYYMALFVDNVTAVRRADGAIEEGVILGEYSSFAHLAGFSWSYRF